MDDLLISVRALHFAATISVCGVVIFQAFVGEPAFRVVAIGPMAGLVRCRLPPLAWSSLALAVLSSVAWLIVQSAEMSERPLFVFQHDKSPTSTSSVEVPSASGQLNNRFG